MSKRIIIIGVIIGFFVFNEPEREQESIKVVALLWLRNSQDIGVPSDRIVNNTLEYLI